MKRDTLQIHGVNEGAIFSVSQAVFLQMVHLEPGPGQPLSRWINQRARTRRKASIETEMHWIAGHTGIPEKEGADRQANLAREGCRAGAVPE